MIADEQANSNETMQRLSVLGSTGSIGTQTLEIVRLFPDRFRVAALTARSNVDLLEAQAREFRPDYVVIDDDKAAHTLSGRLRGTAVEVLSGRDGLCEVASLPEIDTVVAALVGFAGLESVLAALRAKKKVALANKETLVVAGELVDRTISRHGGTLIPVDSEHSAILQCLVGETGNEVEELVLTASGGPFRERPAGTFEAITRDEALDHPNWSMGAKITIDSATMMNKGLEVVEARWLFGIDVERISVLVHPQSIIHSMVCFADGSTKAQLGVPNMKVPIQYALSYPARWPASHERLDWSVIHCLDFEEPDPERFPCLRLAYDALREGGTATAVLNAANEEAVSLFLKERILFTDIPVLIEDALESISGDGADTLEGLSSLDAKARAYVLEHARVGTI